MIIVKFTGGLANQMFQYAFFKNLKHLKKQVFVDDFSFSKANPHEYVSLKDIFTNVAFDVAPRQIVNTLGDVDQSILSKINRKLFGDKKSHRNAYNLIYDSSFEKITEDCYLDGYWQSEKYFSEIVDQIRSDFSFPPITDPKNLALRSQINRNNSVAIHVRKGKDYESKSRNGVCDEEYYKRAVDQINLLIENPEFYVFSDNFSWCDNHLKFVKATYVDWNPSTGKSLYLDMQLMSLCKHNIIANSSYSWWGAWLNSNPGKLIVAPKIWFKPKTVIHNVSDMLPDRWIKL